MSFVSAIFSLPIFQIEKHLPKRLSAIVVFNSGVNALG